MSEDELLRLLKDGPKTITELIEEVSGVKRRDVNDYLNTEVEIRNTMWLLLDMGKIETTSGLKLKIVE